MCVVDIPFSLFSFEILSCIGKSAYCHSFTTPAGTEREPRARDTTKNKQRTYVYNTGARENGKPIQIRLTSSRSSNNTELNEKTKKKRKKKEKER